MQVAGHGFIQSTSECIIKPTTKKEALFYSEIVNEYPQYSDFVPECYRITDASRVFDSEKAKHLKESRNYQKCIFLENLTCGYVYPCVMDVKIGVKNHRDNASPERKAKSLLKRLTTTSGSLGLRIVGFNYGSEVSKSSKSLRNYLKKDFVCRLGDFLKCRKNNCQCNMGQRVLSVVDNMLLSLASNHELRLYGSSLLITYDESDHSLFDVRLIDFSNYYKLKDPKSQDDGFVFGLKNLQKILRTLVLETDAVQ